MIDADLGLSGASTAHRSGFQELVGRVGLSEVGMILSVDVTRLARNCSDWYPLLDICGLRGCLIADRDGVYDPRQCQRTPSAWPQGHHIRTRAAYDPQPPDDRLDRQGTARGARPSPCRSASYGMPVSC
ncbi:recombinase family protein [Roseovarius sp. M141]|uniref:recombinase family protein n=1 Tax=Roseovarius sp. M141 TaxID=2583806 RepID=UPI0034E9354A